MFLCNDGTIVSRSPKTLKGVLRVFSQNDDDWTHERDVSVQNIKTSVLWLLYTVDLCVLKFICERVTYYLDMSLLVIRNYYYSSVTAINNNNNNIINGRRTAFGPVHFFARNIIYVYCGWYAVSCTDDKLIRQPYLTYDCASIVSNEHW